MTTDPLHPTTESLEPAECWRLMRTQQIARIASRVGDRVEMFPFNVGIDGESIVIRTAPGTMLSNIIVAREVVVETDGVEDRDGVEHAWSTLVRGRAELIDTLAEEVKFEHEGPRPWQAGVKNELVRITADEITGRRFPVTPRPSEF